MKHASLFSGIGGFDLAAQWMGWENVFHCEINTFGQKVLKHYWPNSISYHDITKTDFTIHRGAIDILTGGFPCQPYSSAGKRLGTEDERHLWPEMLRAIREIQPRYVVGENVRGLTNWNGGLVFDQVQADLEDEGFEVLPFLLPACAVNAPHRRDRIWFVAHATGSTTGSPRTSRSTEGSWSNLNDKQEGGRITAKLNNGFCSVLRITTHNQEVGCERQQPSVDGRQEHQQNDGCSIRNITSTDGQESDAAHSGGEQLQKRSQDIIAKNREENGTGLDDRIELSGDTRDATNTDQKGLQGKRIGGWNDPKERKIENGSIKQHTGNDWGTLPTKGWSDFPTQSPVCSRNDGVPSGLVGITIPKHRVESIMAYGNAIVPQVALQIFKAIEATDK